MSRHLPVGYTVIEKQRPRCKSCGAPQGEPTYVLIGPLGLNLPLCAEKPIRSMPAATKMAVEVLKARGEMQ